MIPASISASRRSLAAACCSCLRKNKSRIGFAVVLILCGLLSSDGDSFAQTRTVTSQIDVPDFNRQVPSFLESEMTAHVADIKTLEPPPDRVVCAVTTGAF